MDHLMNDQPYELTRAELDSVSGGVLNAGLINADVILKEILTHNSILNNNHVNVAINALGGGVFQTA